MKIFVIGATGFVGSHVAQRFRNDGHTVFALSRSAEGDRRIAAWGVTPVRGDAEKPETMVPTCRDCDATIYAPQLLVEPEQQSVSAIIDALAGTGKTLIFTSGTGVLGQKTDGAWSEDTFAEDDPFTPPKPIKGRVDTEWLVRRAGTERGLRGIVIRPPMIWGDDGCAVVTEIHNGIKKTGDVCYIGAGLNLYSNVHIFDLVEVYALALAKGVSGALYHAVSGEVNYRMMAENIAKAKGLKARSVTPAEAEDIWGKFYAKLVFGVSSRSRCPRTRKELGWTPRHLDLREMFEQTIK
jgi:nucleoside-diphosphate-sugar epimerase